MRAITIRNFKPEDIALVYELNRKYRKAYPETSEVQAEVYNSPEFEGGKNVFCAFDETGALAGYAPVYPCLAEAGSGNQNVLWVDIKADPDFRDKTLLRDMLFEKMTARAVEISNNAPVKNTRICCCYSPKETGIIDFFLSKGFMLTDGIYNLARDLGKPVTVTTIPEGLEIIEWRMETEKERAKYIESYNTVFPEKPWSVEGLEYFMRSDMWVGGTAITAFSGNDIAGSIMLYWAPGQTEGERRLACTENIFVMPQWRRKGLGSCLIGRGLSYLARHGAKTALLEVRVNNIKALDIYKRMGYTIVKEQKVLEYHINDGY